MGNALAVLGAPVWGGGNLHSYLLSLAPTLYCKFNEATGNIVNYGSDGGTGTVTGCTQAQAGQLGAGEAYLFDGVDDIVTFANAAVPTTKALTTQRWCFLVNASGLGESNAGSFFVWNGGAYPQLRFLSSNRMNAVLPTDGTSPTVTSNINQVTFLGSWALVFMDYDNADALGLGRKIRLLVATAAAATTLLTLATNTAGTGTYTVPGTVLSLGAKTDGTQTFAGLMDFALGGAGLWSPAGAPLDLTVPNRIHNLVFGV